MSKCIFVFLSFFFVIIKFIKKQTNNLININIIFEKVVDLYIASVNV